MNYIIITINSTHIKIRGYYETLEKANKNLRQFTNIGLKNIFICKNEYFANNFNYKDNKLTSIELETFNNNNTLENEEFLEQNYNKYYKIIVFLILIMFIIIYFYVLN
tara:strand:+ start:2751 stop:3074 length:324 start_codon:yes stop_codon:yes gene_type:complete